MRDDLFIKNSIKLTQGKWAIVSPEDYERISKHKWFTSSGGYAVRSEPGKTIRMHNEVLRFKRIKNGKEVDHINRDKLDNRRENLRIVTHYENCINRGVNRNNRSGIKGVRWQKNKCKWSAQIQIGGYKHLGYFNSKEEASKVVENVYKDYQYA